MAPGPFLIFDKSALQSFSLDETNWLDNFYYTIITPIFFAETLADLEKEVSRGRSPEDVVGSLAHKTPDMSASPSVHHRTILGSALMGHEVPIRPTLLRSGGRLVKLGDGNSGVFYDPAPEEEALNRWYNHEFLDLERQAAKNWRRDLSGIDHTATYQYFQNWFLVGKPKTDLEVKNIADSFIDGWPQDAVLKFALGYLGISQAFHPQIIQRWNDAGSPPIKDFCPYFRYYLGVALFFDLGIASDRISRERPKGKADNKVDLAYLYYLPFCHVFTSMDKLHKRVVPLFLGSDQSFIDGAEMKADLAKLDAHYSAMPEEVRNSSFFRFASYPPDDTSFLTTRLWDRHSSHWRANKAKAESEPKDKDEEARIVAEINRVAKMAENAPFVSSENTPSQDETQFVQLRRMVSRRKGKWIRYSDDVL